MDFTPTPLEQKCYETGLKRNIVYGNHTTENPQDYARNLSKIVRSWIRNQEKGVGNGSK